MRRRIKVGEEIIVQMGNIRVYFSVAETVEGSDDGQTDRWKSFMVNIERERDTDGMRNRPPMLHAVDLDVLQPDQDVVLPIGPARRSNRLHCQTHEQQFTVTFDLPA